MTKGPPKTFEQKEIKRLKRQNYDLRQELNRMRKALKHNNLYVEAGAVLEKKEKVVREKKDVIKSNEFNKRDFLEKIKEQRKSDGTWRESEETVCDT